MRETRVNHLLQGRRPSSAESPRPARVLVVEQEPFAADTIAARLYERSHTTVTWCRSSDGQVDCSQYMTGGCPLHGPVDVVLDVRTREGGSLSEGETGVACAGLEGIPVIVAAPVRPTPEQAPWALARCTIDEAADFCSHVLEHPEPWQELRLEDLVRRVVDLGDDDAGKARVELVRWPDAVAVVVSTERPLNPDTCTAIDQAVRSLRPPVAHDDVELRLTFTELPTG